MEQVFQGRSLLAEKDFTKEEIEYLIDFSIHLKGLKKKYPAPLFRRKNIALLFEKHRLGHGRPLRQLPSI